MEAYLLYKYDFMMLKYHGWRLDRRLQYRNKFHHLSGFKFNKKKRYKDGEALLKFKIKFEFDDINATKYKYERFKEELKNFEELYQIDLDHREFEQIYSDKMNSSPGYEDKIKNNEIKQVRPCMKMLSKCNKIVLKDHIE